jgi:hypothetical protein
MTLYTLAPGIVRDLPPAVPPAHPWGPVEPVDGARAVVTLQVAMTRDMLALALDGALHGDYVDLDTWTVQQIHEYVEMTLALDGPWHLEKNAPSYPDLLDNPELRPNVQAIYRAVDRAYPLYATKES